MRANPARIAFSLAIALVLVAPRAWQPAFGAPPRQNELALFRAIDPRVVQRLDDAAQSDPSGAIGNNRAAFLQIGLQNQSSWIVPNALVQQDASKLDRALRIIEYGFAHQNADGSFEFHVGSSGTADTELSRAGNAAFFYADLGHTLALLSESQWYLDDPATAGSRARIAKLTPKISRGLDRLVADADVLMGDQAAVNRTLNYGLAFYLVGGALHRGDAVAVGKRFVGDALDRQTPDGVFPEAGGFDSSYQGVSLYLSQIIYTNSADDDGALRDRLWPAIQKAANRELSSIDPSGKVSMMHNSRISAGGERLFGVVKSVDGRSVTLALLYYGNLSQSASVQSTGMSIARTYHMLAH